MVARELVARAHEMLHLAQDLLAGEAEAPFHVVGEAR
jgi:hypothetical protein